MPTHRDTDGTLKPDETQAGMGPVDDTEIVEPVVDYPETPEAWSVADTELVEVRSWASTWGHAAAITGVCVAVAFAVGVIGVAIVIASGNAPGVEPTPIRLPTMTAPTPAALPPATAAPPAASPPAPVAASPDDDEFIAVAISPNAVAALNARHAGAYGTAGTQSGADTIALSECNATTAQTDCVLVNQGMFHGCVGYAIYGARWAGGMGQTRADAIADAEQNLRVTGGATIGVECSTPPGKILSVN